MARTIDEDLYMKTFCQFREVAPPSSVHSQKYYHGTHNQEAANAILRDGIKPPEITYKRSSRLTPMRGKVYLGPLGEAVVYAIGGAVAGFGWKDTPPEQRHPGISDNRYSIPAHALDIDKDSYGYVFGVNGTDLVDVEPDEDSVGSAVYQLVNGHFYGPMGERLKKALGQQTVFPLPNGLSAYGPDGNDRTAALVLVSLAQRYMTPKQYHDVKFGEYDQYAAGGKRIMSRIPNWVKHKLIDWGANVAHSGVVVPTECWRINRRRDVPLLGFSDKKFFDVAERIK